MTIISSLPITMAIIMTDSETGEVVGLVTPIDNPTVDRDEVYSKIA